MGTALIMVQLSCQTPANLNKQRAVAMDACFLKMVFKFYICDYDYALYSNFHWRKWSRAQSLYYK